MFVCEHLGEKVYRVYRSNFKKYTLIDLFLIYHQTNFLNNDVLLIGQRQVYRSDSSLIGDILVTSAIYSPPDAQVTLIWEKKKKTEWLRLQLIYNFVCCSFYDLSFYETYISNTLCVIKSDSISSIDQNFVSSDSVFISLSSTTNNTIGTRFPQWKY